MSRVWGRSRGLGEGHGFDGPGWRVYDVDDPWFYGHDYVQLQVFRTFSLKYGFTDFLSLVINASFWSPKWPYPITAAIYIDGVANIVDLQDYSATEVPYEADDTVLPTIPSNIIFTYTGSVNEPHTIVVTTPPSGSVAVMDMFRFVSFTRRIETKILTFLYPKFRCH